MPASSPVVIDQLVACDGKEPGRERSLAIVGDPALMQRQKSILDQIVRVLRVRRQPSLEIALQQMPQNTEQTAIGILVPVKGQKHQRLQLEFAHRHHVFQLRTALWRNGYDSIGDKSRKVKPTEFVITTA